MTHEARALAQRSADPEGTGPGGGPCREPIERSDTRCPPVDARGGPCPEGFQAHLPREATGRAHDHGSRPTSQPRQRDRSPLNLQPVSKPDVWPVAKKMAHWYRLELNFFG